MRGSAEHIFDVGEPCVENSLRLPLPSREALAATLGLDPAKRWILGTLHPETRRSLAYNLQMARNFLEALLEREGCEIILSEANADPGGAEMNAVFRACSDPHLHLFASLGQQNYLGLMGEAWCVAGNSSSGVIETPRLGVPTLNVGDRQKGRRLSANILSCSADSDSIRSALDRVGPRLTPDLSFGDGHTSTRIVQHIKDYFHES